MQNNARVIERNYLDDWLDCWFTDSKKTGYVMVTDFHYQKSYGYKDLKALVSDTKGKEKQFISINAFEFGQRNTKSLKQIRNVAIDIDQYNENLNIGQALDEIQALIIDKAIPEPNLILSSRGIQLFYSIDGGASPNMAWLASYITDQLIGKMKHLGADSNAKDIARLMRVPNSVNERNGATVKPEIWNDIPYSLQELQNYCRPLEKFNSKKKSKAKVIRHPKTNERVNLFYRTNYARLLDLDKLIEIREGDFTSLRNVFLYIYSYHQALICNSQKELFQVMNDINDKIYSGTDKAITKGELERTVKSAYKDAEGFFNYYKANGFNIIYKAADGVLKPYKTTSLIDKLSITIDEQRAMKRIHTGEVSKEKERERKNNENRQKGIKTREEYIQLQSSKTDKKLSELKQILKDNDNMKKSQIADVMGVSRQYLGRLLKRIKV